MTARPSPRSRKAWQRELRETPACVAIERLGETLTAEERDHVSHCARCEAESALWEEFREAAPSPDEGGAVRWIAAEVARRRAGHPAAARRRRAWGWGWGGWLGELRPHAFAAAAIVAAAVTLAYVALDREPPVAVPAADRDLYRSGRIEVISPTGDFTTPPTVFSWVAVPGADRYDVVVLEVDRTILWRATTREPRVEPAPGVIAQFVPGKTVLWEVTARGRDAAVLAQSGAQRFRVAIGPRQEE